ncbi:hypothetical protein BDV12DRAFT_194511 [Aspergillus spectabilis]
MPETTIKVPNQPWFTQFFHHWQETPSRVFIRDRETGKKTNFAEFLYEVIVHQDRLESRLSEEVQKRLQDPDEEVFIAIIASGGLDFVVLLFAIYSLGGIAVPLRHHVHLEEARYFLGACNAVLITSSHAAADHAQMLSSSLDIPHISFSHSPKPPLPDIKFTLDTNANTQYNPNRGFALLYTSGTTGSPKGALYTCSSILHGTSNYESRLSLSSSDTWLHHSPAHWKGGFDFLLAGAYTGSCIEFCSSMFTPPWFWERIKHGGISCFLASPTLLASLKEALAQLNEEERKGALNGLKDVRALLTGSMRVPEGIKDEWRGLRGGRELVNMYGFTEAAGMVSMTGWDVEGGIPTDNCGPYFPEFEVKVDEQGELCVKGALLMKRYVSADPNVTNDAFDPNGFYKTGDMGEITTDGEIRIFGRANQDVVRFMGWKINTSSLEDPLRSYPNLTQSFVLGVSDAIYGQRVAALLLRKPTPEAESSLGGLKLGDLRRWLAVEKEVPAYKLPTLLKVVRQDEFRGTTDSGKPSKKKIEGFYFRDWEGGGVQVWDVGAKEDFPGDRAWDWEGRPPT